MLLTYDVAIIGSGVAGMSLAMYLKRAGIKCVLIESSAPGGQLNKIINIENYPGVVSIDGPSFAYNLYNQVNNLGVDFVYEEVNKVEKGRMYHFVYTNNKKIKAKYVVIATGRSPRKLNVENSDSLIGRGISYCALCDGNFYKDKNVLIVGGSRTALEEAMYLSNICKSVIIVHRKDKFTAEEVMINKVLSKDNVLVYYNSNITKINEEDNKLSSVVINNDKKIVIDGLFVCIGYEPNTNFIKDIVKENNYIKVNKNYESSVKRIYAIGDVIDKDIYQITSASNDALVLANYLINKIR